MAKKSAPKKPAKKAASLKPVKKSPSTVVKSSSPSKSVLQQPVNDPIMGLMVFVVGATVLVVIAMLVISMM